MSQNGITDFDDWFCKARHAAVIARCVSGDRIVSALVQMDSVKVAHLEMNPMVSPPPRICLEARVLLLLLLRYAYDTTTTRRAWQELCDTADCV